MSTQQSQNTISLKEAEFLTTNWRTFISPIADKQTYIRAFWIPISDIVDLGEFHDVSAVRAYICMEDPNDTSTTKIVLVPVDDNNKDILSVPNSGYGGDPDDSSIYDFTKPCPQACDIESPLFYNP